jgi:hypothetical protein
MGISSYSEINYYFILVINLCLLIQGSIGFLFKMIKKFLFDI